MPFDVASIKSKAVSAKNATVSKVQNVRDRHTSTPMKNTRFVDAGYLQKQPPPPPPLRNSVNSARSSRDRQGGEDGYGQAPPPPPPPLARSTKPSSSAPTPSPPPPPPSRGPSVFSRAKAFDSQPPTKPLAPPAPSREPSTRKWSTQQQAQASRDSINSTNVKIDQIDWVNLSAEDKQEFFDWLDEFFERYIEKMRGVRLDNRELQGQPAETGDAGFAERVKAPPPPAAPPVPSAAAVPGRGAPPPIKLASKPALDAVPSQPSREPFVSSYPPPSTHGSHALHLAYYFHPSTSWPTPWYASQGAVPPPLLESQHRLYRAQMMARGDFRSLTFGALFCDLSTAWVSVTFSGSTNQVKDRTAKYLPPPAAMTAEELRRESKMYGETIAAFAESFLGSGQFCARGECWDLASEALKYITENSDPSVPKPIPSLGRTHGHLIFVGKSNGGRQEGRWRGGDDRVRRGDIVEWRTVRISRIGDPPGGFAILGDPEHTAVITRDTVPSTSVYDDASVQPGQLRTLEVVEQSRNDPPEPVKRTYDLTKFQQGEIWIYRPVSMLSYIGFPELTCEAPAHAVSV